MGSSKRKKWTILIFANGNNEMEPEMYKALKDCEKIGSNDEVDVIMEIGRAKISTVEKNRISKPFINYDDNWIGVRRYHIKSSKSELIDDLGKINMADPNNLYEFIKWGIENYKSEHYMLILSGHGVRLVGGLTDLTFNVPYIMGIPEMSKGINLVKEKLGYEIDILVLDMCYMNSIETIYELGKDENNAINSMITYTGYAPIGGLPYNEVIRLMQEYCNIDNLHSLIMYLIDGLKFNLAAFEINNKKLKEIKKIFNNLAYSYIFKKDKNIENPVEVIKKIPLEREFSEEIQYMNKVLSSIVIHRKKENNKFHCIKIIPEYVDKIISFYSKLSFAQNNYWTRLVGKRNIIKGTQPRNKIKIRPEGSPKSAAYHYILPLIIK